MQNHKRAARAQNDEDKQQREQQIIDAAQDLFAQKGYFNINMNEVAQAVGLAKGTLYLYFNTKEELFLAVFERQFRAWCVQVNTALDDLPESVAVDTMARLLVQSVADKSQLTRLFVLSPIMFEQNIRYEQARAHKLWQFNAVGEIGARIAAKLGLQPQSGTHILLRAYIFISGLEGLAHPAPVSHEVYQNEPSLPKVDFETELYNLLRLTLQAYADADEASHG